jgi:hypothetical protein
MKKSGDRSTPAVSPVRQKSQDNKRTRIAARPISIHGRDHLAAHDAARAAALGLTRAFGCKSVRDVPPIDAIIMRRLSAAFASIDDELQDACLQRGLLPRNIGESLRMARFLSITLPLARAAQSDTGVPASILIAEAHLISGPSFYGCTFELARPEWNDIFATRKKFKSMGEAFSARALWLTQQPSFHPIMRATGDATLGFTQAAYPANFMDLIAAWSKPTYGNDLVETISSHNLLECDRMVPVK